MSFFNFFDSDTRERPRRVTIGDNSPRWCITCGEKIDQDPNSTAIEYNCPNNHWNSIFHYSEPQGGYIQNCPTCEATRKTTCSACGCGNCLTCGQRFSCGSDIIINLEPQHLKIPQTKDDKTINEIDKVLKSGMYPDDQLIEIEMILKEYYAT